MSFGARRGFFGLWLILALGLLLLLPFLMIAPSKNADTLYQLFDQHAQVQLLPTDKRLLAEGMSGFLSGQRETAQVTLRDKPAFSQKEQLHLQDVRALYALSDKVVMAGGGLMALGLALIILLKKPLLSAVNQAARAVLLLLLMVGFIALFDFTGLFRLFHLLAFDNELWLLNPATDLLIQLMPQGFFTDYLAKAALWPLLLLLFLSLRVPQKEKTP